MGLYDKVSRLLSRKLDPAVLRDELTAPTVTGLRSIITGHPEEGLGPVQLAGLLREAELGNLIPAMWLAEAMEEKNLHYRSVLATRKLQVSALPIQVTAASDDAIDQRAADLVRDFCEGPLLRGALFDILDAVGKGFSVSELIWELQLGEWRPARIEWRFPQWFVFDRVDGKTILMRGGPGDGASAFQAAPDELSRGNFGTPLPPNKFITHIHRSKSGLPIRGGLMRPAAWAYMFQNFSVKAWAIFLEVYGHPLRVGKYETGASKEDKATLLRAVRNIATDAAAIIPQGMEIEFVEAANSTGASPHQVQLDWWNAQISKLVLGQTGTTDAGQYVGTADAHEHVRGDICDDDAAQLGASLSRDVVRPLVDLNVGPRPRYPILSIGEPETEDTAALMDNIKTFVALGGQVSESWLGGKLGVPPPEPGEAVLKAPAPVPAFGAAPNGDGDEQDPAGANAADLPAPATAKGGRFAVQAQLPQTAAPVTDAIDALQDDQLADWHPMIKPLVDPIQALLAECSTLEEFLSRLPELVAKQNPAKLAQSLAEAAFAARLAGLTGAPIAPDSKASDAG
jgi:phage gp29-like protein